MAVCPLFAQLPLPRRQSRDVQSSCHLGQDGPFASQPPGASFWWGSLQLQEEFLGAGYACPVDKDIVLSPDNLIRLTWNLALGIMVATVPAPR